MIILAYFSIFYSVKYTPSTLDSTYFCLYDATLSCVLAVFTHTANITDLNLERFAILKFSTQKIDVHGKKCLGRIRGTTTMPHGSPPLTDPIPQGLEHHPNRYTCMLLLPQQEI